MLIRGLLAALFIALIGCSGSSVSAVCEGLTAQECMEIDGGMPPEPTFVVDTDWLKEHFNDPDIQMIDTRGSGYEASRIPGAIHLRPGDLATMRDGVPSQVMPPMQAEPVLRAKGVRNDTIAVVYGEPLEYDPSRVVWTLSYYRHGDVRYLDGGFPAWIDSGGELDTDPPSVEASNYAIVGVDDGLRVTGDWVLEQLGDAPYDMPAIQLVDARTEGEYGNSHIPTARSVNWTRNLQTGFLRPRGELEMLYDGMDPTQTTVTYCVSGWRGSFAWLSLTALGYEDVRLYDGSWNEWGSGGFPIEP